jgi:hypothetical protein
MLKKGYILLGAAALVGIFKLNKDFGLANSVAVSNR